MTSIDTVHVVTFDHEDRFWRCSCPNDGQTPDECPLTALHVAYAASIAVGRTGASMDPAWPDLAVEAHDVLGEFLYPLSGPG